MIEMSSFSSLPEWPGIKLLELRWWVNTPRDSAGVKSWEEIALIAQSKASIVGSSKLRKLLMQRASIARRSSLKASVCLRSSSSPVDSGGGIRAELSMQLEFLEGLDVVTTSGKRLGDKYGGRRLLYWRHRHGSVGKYCKCQRQNKVNAKMLQVMEMLRSLFFRTLCRGKSAIIVVSSLLVRIEAKQRVFTVIVGQYEQNKELLHSCWEVLCWDHWLGEKHNYVWLY